ncbi:MAG: DUF2100 domain-containing protein, partial [Promethearchaeota archaeon]
VLKNLGFNPLKLIVSGGPLVYTDYLKINPNLSGKALRGIKKKVNNVIHKLKNIAKENSKLTFIYDGNNKTDQVILQELKKNKDMIGLEVNLLEIPDWKKLEL